LLDFHLKIAELKKIEISDELIVEEDKTKVDMVEQLNNAQQYKRNGSNGYAQVKDMEIKTEYQHMMI
jgi:hypothetical protein